MSHQQRPSVPEDQGRVKREEEEREARTKQRRGITWPPTQRPLEESGDEKNA